MTRQVIYETPENREEYADVPCEFESRHTGTTCGMPLRRHTPNPPHRWRVYIYSEQHSVESCINCSGPRDFYFAGALQSLCAACTDSNVKLRPFRSDDNRGARGFLARGLFMIPCHCIHPLSEHDERGCSDPICDCESTMPEYGPGIYPNIEPETYHKLPFVGSTVLKSFRTCPASVLLPREATEDMNLGSAVHTWVLEGPRAFESRFAIMFESDLNKNTTEYKRQKTAFVEANADRVILPAYPKGVDVPTLDVLKGVEASLRSHPMAGLLLNQSGIQEVSMIWDDPESGLRCKGRIDRDPGRKTLVELKKCADLERFPRQIMDMSYDVQAGMYTNGAEALGIEADTFVFIAVNHAPPYEVRTDFLSADYLDWAKHEAKRLLRLYAECREANFFPAYKLTGVNSMSEMSPHQVFNEIEKPGWRV